MKLKLTALTSLFALITVFSCGTSTPEKNNNNDNPPVEVTHKLKASPTMLRFPGESGSQSFSLEANVPWTATDDASWLSFTPESGSGNSKITVSVEANPSSTAIREGTITITTGKIALVFKVSQDEGSGEPEQPVDPEQPERLSAAVSTGSASSITVESAYLTATYSGANATVREVGFDWGQTSTLGKVLQADVTAPSASSGTFGAALEGLGDGMTYYYRAYVMLERGDEIETFYGETRSFKTQVQEDKPTSSVPAWPEMPSISVSFSGQYMTSTTDATQYYAWHICPDVYGPGGHLARNYTVCYSSKYHCSLWVAAPLHSMYKGGSGRTEAYDEDPDIPYDIQWHSKSNASGYNKGHLLGSADRSASAATNRQVYYYPNIAPQLSSGFNTGGGGWNLLEDYVDGQVCKDTLYAVIGCYFDKYTDGYGNTVTPATLSQGSRNDVAKPTMFYYVLLRTKSGTSGKSVKNCSADELKCVAFVRCHTNDLKGQKASSRELMSVADLEKITGVTYFPNVPNAPKSSYKASDWGL